MSDLVMAGPRSSFDSDGKVTHHASHPAWGVSTCSPERISNPFAALLGDESAIEAHSRAEPGRVVINLHDGLPDDAPSQMADPGPINFKKVRKPRTPKPIDWKAESAALCMPIGVLRDRHPETAHERRKRLAAWSELAIAERMQFERWRRKTSKHIAYLRKRVRLGTA